MNLNITKKFMLCLVIILPLILYTEEADDEKNKSKDSSVEKTQTATTTTGSKNTLASTPYQAPRSISYPMGDENMINNNMLNSSATSEANCADENEFMEFKPECTGPVDGTDEIYVACLKNELTEGPTDSIYSSLISANTNPVVLPELMCKRCDLQKNEDNSAVIINCHECYDLRNSLNRTRVNITCIASFLQIKNYTKTYREYKEFIE
ncbi:hypothetical protein WA026_002302 [Henosepilachna vigintioctopunctata]|uniref:Uncharacterized protein n=1 Tax=Henosepilachna vigintioctopunctata TaxID=420089 RepID=A0AAW1TT51_9CUCU